MPLVGLGTGGFWAGNVTAAYHGAKEALKVGYRAFDSAHLYANGKGLGQALKESGLKRNEYWITTKIGGGTTFNQTLVQAE